MDVGVRVIDGNTSVDACAHVLYEGLIAAMIYVSLCCMDLGSRV